MVALVANLALLLLLAAITIAILKTRSLLAVVALGAIYSFLMATIMFVLDAPDVALTEASVGAGISTVLLLATLHLTRTTEEAAPRQKPWLPLAVALCVGAALVYGTVHLPKFGDAQSAMNTHPAPVHYLRKGEAEMGFPNMVTGVLASYRGYDTLGETTVVFTAGAVVIALLRGRRAKSEPKGAGDAE
jgi:multicomponent Na+:H+ antiporter subunit B